MSETVRPGDTGAELAATTVKHFVAKGELVPEDYALTLPRRGGEAELDQSGPTMPTSEATPRTLGPWGSGSFGSTEADVLGLLGADPETSVCVRYRPRQ
ncbi:hypothetical protein LWC34_26800 [Kibdelosporangium philippinense]|uniref:Uncharacterized protein n=1 Tax=Kibdelosporangium philippinense TaxID=211113 RepID=A0ABS8ZF12_9PSEU|nr:hypothetical protein [Kibdelosporangium philippinense]MCE7006411.1 hypothetical protein [Kibdelosporangium philippinense]